MDTLLLINDNTLHLTKTADILAGSISVGGTPVERQILVYKNYEACASLSTISDSSGNWSIPIVANANDKFRVEVIGKVENGEFSKIYEDVVID